MWLRPRNQEAKHILIFSLSFWLLWFIFLTASKVTQLHCWAPRPLNLCLSYFHSDVRHTRGRIHCKNTHIYRNTYNQTSEKHGDPAGNNMDCSIIIVGFNQINENMLLLDLTMHVNESSLPHKSKLSFNLVCLGDTLSSHSFISNAVWAEHNSLKSEHLVCFKHTFSFCSLELNANGFLPINKFKKNTQNIQMETTGHTQTQTNKHVK